jgi:hypothetical protein
MMHNIGIEQDAQKTARLSCRALWQKTILGGNGMDKLPSLDKKTVNVTSLDDIEEEKKYWISKSPLERIEAIEINRRMVYGQDRVTSRLQRFFETAELS